MGVIETVSKCVHDPDIPIDQGAKVVHQAICSMTEAEFVDEFSQCALHGDGVACLLFGADKFPCTNMPCKTDEQPEQNSERNKAMVDNYVHRILNRDNDGASRVIHRRIIQMAASTFAEYVSDVSVLPKKRAFQVTITFPCPVDEQLPAPAL